MFRFDTLRTRVRTALSSPSLTFLNPLIYILHRIIEIRSEDCCDCQFVLKKSPEELNEALLMLFHFDVLAASIGKVRTARWRASAAMKYRLKIDEHRPPKLNRPICRGRRVAAGLVLCTPATDCTRLNWFVCFYDCVLVPGPRAPWIAIGLTGRNEQYHIVLQNFSPNFSALKMFIINKII